MIFCNNFVQKWAKRYFSYCFLPTKLQIWPFNDYKKDSIYNFLVKSGSCISIKTQLSAYKIWHFIIFTLVDINQTNFILKLSESGRGRRKGIPTPTHGGQRSGYRGHYRAKSAISWYRGIRAQYCSS